MPTHKPKGPTGICPGCGGRYALRSDGLIRSHAVHELDSARCAGALKRPQAEFQRTR
jgi:hypothetical protein